MAPLRCAAKLDPFLSLDCAPTPSTLAQSKERKGSNFAIWQPCTDRVRTEAEEEKAEAADPDSVVVHSLELPDYEEALNMPRPETRGEDEESEEVKPAKARGAEAEMPKEHTNLEDEEAEEEEQEELQIEAETVRPMQNSPQLRKRKLRNRIRAALTVLEDQVGQASLGDGPAEMQIPLGKDGTPAPPSTAAKQMLHDEQFARILATNGKRRTEVTVPFTRDMFPDLSSMVNEPQTYSDTIEHLPHKTEVEDAPASALLKAWEETGFTQEDFEMSPKDGKLALRDFLELLANAAKERASARKWEIVKMQIEDLVAGKIVPLIFSARIHTEIMANPQPSLALFVDKYLPYLQASLKSGDIDMDTRIWRRFP